MKRKREESSGGSWLDTYADMVTLLLTFFVVMFSMSSVEQEKWDALIRSFIGEGEASQVVFMDDDPPTGSGVAVNEHDEYFTDDNGIETSEIAMPENVEDLYEYLNEYVTQNNLQSSVSLSKDSGVVYIRFSNNTLFKPNKYDLTEEARPMLDYLGKALKLIEDKINVIQVSGHTADMGRPSLEVNDWRLSGERAASVVIYLEEVNQIKKGIFVTNGYGDNYPIADNSTEDGRRQNRRVELTIVGTEAIANDPAISDGLEGTYDTNQYPKDGQGMKPIVPDNKQQTASQSPQEPVQDSQETPVDTNSEPQ